MVAVAITRTDLTAVALRGAAARRRDAQAARRMLALALVVDGVERTTAAKTCGMDRQTLRDRVHRCNTEGLAGLANRKAPARSRRLGADQVADLAGWVEAGPDPGARTGSYAGGGRTFSGGSWNGSGWSCTSAQGQLSVGKYLAMLGYRRLSLRPQQPKSDPGAQALFKKSSAREERPRSRRPPGENRLKSGSRVSHVTPLVRVTMANARIGQQGTLTRGYL